MRKLRHIRWTFKELIAVVAALAMAAVPLLQRHFLWAIVAMVAVVCASLFLVSLIVYRRRIVVGREWSPSGTGVERPRYRPAIRRLALIGIVLSPLSLAGVLALLLWPARPNDNEILIVVANIGGPGEEDYRITETVLEQLDTLSAKYPELRIEPLGESISPQEGSAVAREKGRSRGANLVVWGWYGKTAQRVVASMHFELISTPRRLELNRRTDSINEPAAMLETFAVQTDITKKVSSVALVAIGLGRFEAGAFKDSIDRLTDALTSMSDSDLFDRSGVLFYRAYAYAELGLADLAIADYGEAIKSQPDLRSLRVNRAKLLSDSGQCEQAIADYDVAIRLVPTHAGSYNNRGNCFLERGDFDHAIEDFNEALRLEPRSAMTLNNRGSAHRRLGRLDLALEDFNSALKVDPSYALAYNSRGNLYAIRRDDTLALADYNKALELNPRFALAYNNRANIYHRSGDSVSAMADLNEAIRLRPTYADAYVNRGSKYLASANVTLARRDLDRAIKISPNNALAYYYRAAALAAQNERVAAEEDLARALQLSGGRSMEEFALLQPPQSISQIRPSTGVPSYAQEPNVVGGTVSGHAHRLTKVGGERRETDLLCGDYLYGVPDPPRHPIIVFQYDEFKPDGSPSQSQLFMRSDKFVTIIDPTADIPTAAFSDHRGTGKTPPFYWTVRVSETEFAAASRCLPPPR